ncbi:hypothetical protein FCM35_KLT03840 [Carex littledalei]|uniref:Uncharacterized protein n=1 Tax=Carex littledalei TaxID=544730 RepID=A0A833R608_9POAL|nr:hypothetical protein FCM35_KLT03840 [Carex littledalei]
MPLEETLHRQGLSFSPARGGLATTRLYGVLAGQPRALRSPATVGSRKPPEPLRRAVADCLSPPASHLHGSSGASSSSIAVEASRTLRDYIASPATVDIAYSVLVEYAIAERDRSPAVVPRCIALLKRYLAKYIPRVQTLRQIELFCANSLSKCEPTGNQLQSNSFISPPSASNFTNPSLVKSITYVRSLVAKHIPKLSFQPIGLSVPPRQPFNKPTLSSIPSSRSFSLKLNSEAGAGQDSVELKQVLRHSNLEGSSTDVVGIEDDSKYILFDILKWRWHLDQQQAPSTMKESGDAERHQDICIYRSPEVGAAAIFLGDMDGTRNSQHWRDPAVQDLLDINSLQPSQATPSTDFALSRSHLKAITASKRMKVGPNEIWSNIPSSAFQARAKPLFQYRHYCEQQPLKLNPAEINEVITEVCNASCTPNGNQLNAPSRLSSQNRQPSADVAFSVLIKLIIDMYMMDPETAGPLTLYMLEGILSSQKPFSKTRAFDLILNLGVHAHLLEPMLSEDVSPIIENDELPEGSYSKSEEQNSCVENHPTKIAAIENFESWLLAVLFEILLLLVQMEEKEEIVWASALSCLFYFVCDRGNIIRKRLEGLDIRVIKTLLEVSREHTWAMVVRCKLICMLTNMLYQLSPTDGAPTFLMEQINLLGGIDYICFEYSRAESKQEKRDLFMILLDYAVHQINEMCIARGVSTYTYEDIKPLVSLFMVGNHAPEAFYLTVKYGVEGTGDILRSSISRAISHTVDNKHLSLLLEKIINKLEDTVRSFSGIDHEFIYMVQMTKTYRSLKSIKEGSHNPEITIKASLAWTTLHSLLHADTSACRHHGYIWLVDLLVCEICTDNQRGGGIWSNIQQLQQQISDAGSEDMAARAGVPLSVSVLCGLLKSKHNFIRWGFLFVLEMFLMRVQLLLDQRENSRGKGRLEKAAALVDIMSSALSLVEQNNETDHINILKMCDVLFSQLCRKLPPTSNTPSVEQPETEPHIPERLDSRNNTKTIISDNPYVNVKNCQTTSVAALLLRGSAIAPMPLVSRVPASLFYWPLIQLAGAATDDIALGVAVGSTGRGYLPGSTSDIRAALLLLLIGKCTSDPVAFSEVDGNEFFSGLLEDDMDSRVAYYSANFLLKRMMTEEPEAYQRMLQSLIYKAQQSNNEKLLENPYLQMRGILQLSTDLGIDSAQ